jgi:hypothetical protein
MSLFLPYLSSMQSACIVLYCDLWTIWLWYIFTHCFIRGKIFKKEVIEHVMCSDFLYNYFFLTYFLS